MESDLNFTVNFYNFIFYQVPKKYWRFIFKINEDEEKCSII